VPPGQASEALVMQSITLDSGLLPPVGS
jgi:hypothetical protein